MRIRIHSPVLINCKYGRQCIRSEWHIPGRTFKNYANNWPTGLPKIDNFCINVGFSNIPHPTGTEVLMRFGSGSSTLLTRKRSGKHIKSRTTITIYAPMIYTAPCIMLWMRAYPLRGEVGGGRALEFESFLDPVKWHRADRRLPFGAQK